LKGNISQSGIKDAPAGHPVHTFLQENAALGQAVQSMTGIFNEIEGMEEDSDAKEKMMQIHGLFNQLSDVEKHYLRKENLLFPYLEKQGITGPPTVMWGKHDETRELLKSAYEVFLSLDKITAGEAKALAEFVLKPAVKAIDEMIYKEEKILLPMCMDTLSEAEWYHIYQQTPEIGYCLYVPEIDWKPESLAAEEIEPEKSGRIMLPSGSFALTELAALFNTLPVDITFVDKDDTVRFFSNSAERIFHRSKAVLGRKVQMCHPPSSVHIVEKILCDFKSGAQDRAAFWIELRGRFIHIEYFAVRDEQGIYIGTLEVSQDLTEKRKLTGEQRLLKYESKIEGKNNGNN